MDGYPEAFLQHNVPLLVASGLGSTQPQPQLPEDLKDRAILLRSDLPALRSREAEVLQTYLREIDEKSTTWDGFNREQELYRFRVHAVERAYLLPPRHAQLPDDVDVLESAPVLHSPFSPLSPKSSLYPDGLIDAQWLQKHQAYVPSIFASFYSLTNDVNSATLEDNKLKADINEAKAVLAKSGYKTRIAVVLLGSSDGWASVTQERIGERLENIRRGTALDPKSIFFIPPQESPAHLTQVFDNVLSILFGNAVEYYLDMSRHVKKKRSRSVAPQPTVPPTSGTSQTLSLPDWNFRYDFKSAIFAEFRQDKEAALRSFEQAYNIVLGSDVLEVIPSWEPRWNEARMLADVIAIRCVRLHFWVGHTTLAVRRWQVHRARMQDLVDRRGMGTDTYGWQAWEARWATLMANMIEKLEPPQLVTTSSMLYVPAEKVLSAERLQPWELLHHTGYWYRMAARYLSARRKAAHQLSEEDRTPPPDASAAGQRSKKSGNHDTYLCPMPWEEFPLTGREGVNHSQLILDALITAQSQYQSRRQIRLAAEISLECAREMVNQELWEEALSVLRPLWENQSFRAEGWRSASEELCWLMRKAAAHSQRGDLVVAVDWELLNRNYTRRPQWHYDLRKSLDGVSVAEKPHLKLSDADASCFVAASFVFGPKQSKAGQPCQAQLCLTSSAMPESIPVTFDSLLVQFQGPLRPIALSHDDSNVDSDESLSVSHVAIEEVFPADADTDVPSEVRGQTDLTLKPGQTRVINLRIPIREAGEVEAIGVTLSYRHESFSLDYSMKLGGEGLARGWFADGSQRPRNVRQDAHVLQILPRPPKLQMRILEPLEQYYANEPIRLKLQLENAEDETAQVKMDFHLYGKDVPAFSVLSGQVSKAAEAAKEESKLTAVPIGKIESKATPVLELSVEAAAGPTTLDVQFNAFYFLESDPATPIHQSLTIPLNIVNAFEANYNLLPRIHPEPWPSLFDHADIVPGEDVDGEAQVYGMVQTWCLDCHYASFAAQDLQVVGLDLRIVSSVGSARCTVESNPANVDGDGITMNPKTIHEAQFELIAQKYTLDDRQPVSLELAFVIQWRRKDNEQGRVGGAPTTSPVNTTSMPVGKYLVLGSEPRVLASVLYSPMESTGLMHMNLTIENPSNHFLTFGLSMEPSDEFAFSGAKQTTVHLLPLSRRTVTYRVLPMVRGKFIRPGLVVKDKYFQKVLRVIPTEGMKVDKDGLLVWVPGQEEGEDEDEDEGEHSYSQRE